MVARRVADALPGSLRLGRITTQGGPDVVKM